MNLRSIKSETPEQNDLGIPGVTGIGWGNRSKDKKEEIKVEKGFFNTRHNLKYTIVLTQILEETVQVSQSISVNKCETPSIEIKKDESIQKPLRWAGELFFYFKLDTKV